MAVRRRTQFRREPGDPHDLFGLLALAGAPLGLRFLVVDSAADACAGQVAPLVQADWCDFDALAGKEWNVYDEQIEKAISRLYRLQTEPWRRWAAGFSCLCFAWVGAPMAIRRRNQDFLTSFFLCFLPILLVYYPLLVWGVDGAKRGELPVYFVWAGNLLLVAWGAYLLRKVVRY